MKNLLDQLKIDSVSEFCQLCLALGFGGAVIYLAIIGKITPTEMIALTGPIVGYYFAKVKTNGGVGG